MQPSHAINEKIELPPEPIQYLNGDHTLDIPVPVAYLGPKILNVRLISSVKREGMVTINGLAFANFTLVKNSLKIIYYFAGIF